MRDAQRDETAGNIWYRRQFSEIVFAARLHGPQRTRGIHHVPVPLAMNDVCLAEDAFITMSLAIW